jgi:multiple sugar transport system permease protein
MSLVLSAGRPRRRRQLSPDRIAAAILGVFIAFWTLLPVYNLLLIALSDDGDEFTGAVYPADPNFESFTAILAESNRYLEGFWHQFGNSIYMGLATMVITVVIGSLAAFAMGRMKLPKAWLFGHLPLITYAVPASFLVIPFTRLMAIYGLTNNLLSVIAAEVAFATPYAILIFHQYGKLIPVELDEAARVDGATPLQVYVRIYLPLMTPALAAVATFALLVAWNEYQYQFLLLTSERTMTVAAAIDQFFDSDEAPWNYMMAMSLVYALPPIVVYYGLRRYMVAGLTMGGVKG